MTGVTHKQFSICGAFIVGILLYWTGLTQIDYFLSLPILILVSKYGGLFPDIDHEWEYIKDKTIPNRIFNFLIHLTRGKHRSWQTHSIDIAVLSLMVGLFLPGLLYNNHLISLVNKEVMSIILLGFSSGWLSHLFSDMLTPSGVRVLCFLKFKLALVPRKFLVIKFSTGSEWEGIVYRVIRIVNIVLGVICLIVPFILPGHYHNILFGG